MEDSFSMDQGGKEGWFQDDSSTFHLLCTLFLLWLDQLHLRSSGIRSQWLGIPALEMLILIDFIRNHLVTWHRCI